MPSEWTLGTVQIAVSGKREISSEADPAVLDMHVSATQLGKLGNWASTQVGCFIVFIVQL